MADPVKDRGSYIDEKVAEAEGIADKANQSLQERDSAAAQQAEKAGVGKDNSDENKRVLIKQMEERAAAFDKLGKSDKAAEIRARIKELQET